MKNGFYKRAVSLVLTLSMALAMMPCMSLSVSAAGLPAGDFLVSGDTGYSFDTRDRVLKIEAGGSYTIEMNSTLNNESSYYAGYTEDVININGLLGTVNLTLVGVKIGTDTNAIYASTGTAVNIVLEGDNYLTADDAGILAFGDLAISGDGSLLVTADNEAIVARNKNIDISGGHITAQYIYNGLIGSAIKVDYSALASDQSASLTVSARTGSNAALVGSTSFYGIVKFKTASGDDYADASGMSLTGSETYVSLKSADPVYTVTFQANSGSTVSPMTGLSSGSTITEPTTTRSGYTFIGWYTDSWYTTAWDFTNDTVTSNITLYAKWAAADNNNCYLTSKQRNRKNTEKRGNSCTIT